ncbi:MAG: Ger(x)C family spore germination C-terminal domain-containing protein [Bacillota bacterium]
MLWDTDYLEQVEHRIEMEVQRRCIHVVDKMQREFKADVFGFGSMLAQKYPDYWKTVKNQWDDKHFPEAEVNVKVTADIRRTETKT